MPRLLIAGCGYLGQAVADLFVANGWQVEGWTMSAESARQLSTKSFPVRAIDISNKNQVRAQCENFDGLIHAASTRGGDANSYRNVYLNGARNLVDSFRKGKMLFVSSTSVYAQAAGEWVTEESAAEPKTETGKILRESEDLVLSKNGIVTRLGGIYGPNRSALLKRFVNNDAIPSPDDDRFMNAIHRDDAAAAIELLLGQKESAGQIYNVVDNEPQLLSECYRWLAARMNRPLPPVGRSPSKRKRGESNKRVSNAKLRMFGWQPRFPNFASGMEESVLRSFNLEER
jgi:nucleoside-diphosphate-sugar epimerase